MQTITVTVEELLEFRSNKNIELYSTPAKNNNQVILMVQATPGIVLQAIGDYGNPKVDYVLQFANKSLITRDKRIVTHNFGDANTWPIVDGVPKSEYLITPSEGMKFAITYIQIRFPKRIKLKKENKLCFQVNLWVDAYQSVLPVINIEYSSIKDLVRKSNTPIDIPTDIIPELSVDKMTELTFKYANPDNLDGSPIILNHSKGENIKIWLSGEESIKDIDDQELFDETWCVVNGKELYDF